MAMSDFLRNSLTDHVLRTFDYAAPTELWLALLTTACVPSDTGTTIESGSGTGEEVSTTATGYGRVQVGPDPDIWSATQGGGTDPSDGTDGESETLVDVDFGPATAGWGTIVGVAICDEETGGNLLLFGLLADDKTVNSGDTVHFAAGDIVSALT